MTIQKPFGVVGEMTGSDEIMGNTLFLGTYPGLTKNVVDRG